LGLGGPIMSSADLETRRLARLPCRRLGTSRRPSPKWSTRAGTRTRTAPWQELSWEAPEGARYTLGVAVVEHRPIPFARSRSAPAAPRRRRCRRRCGCASGGASAARDRPASRRCRARTLQPPRPSARAHASTLSTKWSCSACVSMWLVFRPTIVTACPAYLIERVAPVSVSGNGPLLLRQAFKRPE
jgi:hypothetical protein